MNLIKAENRELTHSRYQSTKGIPTETTGPGTGLLLGTDFRHAVEFSRSGRAAIRPSRAFVTGGLSNHTSHSDVPRSGVRSGALPGRRGAWRTVHEAFGSRRGPSAGPALSDVEHDTRPPPGLPVTAATCVSGRFPEGADRSALRRTGATTRPSPGRFPLRATSVTAGIRRSLRRPPV